MSSIIKGLNESTYRNYDANRTGFSRGPRDDERHDLDIQQPTPQQWALKINGKVWSKDGNTVTFDSKEKALKARQSLLARRPELEVGLVTRGGVAEESHYDIGDFHNAKLSGDYGKDLTTSGISSSGHSIDKGANDGQRGRPSSNKLAGVSKALPADPFNRTTGKIPQGIKGRVHSTMDPDEQLDEISNEKLAKYKTAAAADAKKADSEGDYKRGDKRFSGIVKATKKQFANDEKNVEEEKQRLDPKCWTGYKKQGTKMKGGVRVNNCVPVKETNSNILKGLQQVDEGWKEKLGAAALAGSMALGAAGAQARVTPGDDPNINRLNGQPIATQQTTTAPTRIDSPTGPSGFSKEYLQKAADPNRFGRYMISVEKAQELLKQMNEEQLDEKWSQKYKDSINCSNPKGFSQKAHCAGKNK